MTPEARRYYRETVAEAQRVLAPRMPSDGRLSAHGLGAGEAHESAQAVKDAAEAKRVAMLRAHRRPDALPVLELFPALAGPRAADQRELWQSPKEGETP